MSKENLFTAVGIVNHCCQLGRIFGIWFLLTRFDEQELLLRTQASNSKKKGSKTTKVTGVGYGGSLLHAYEFDMYDGILTQNNIVPPKDDEDDKLHDVLITATLKLLTAFLPSYSASNPPTEVPERQLFTLSR